MNTVITKKEVKVSFILIGIILAEKVLSFLKNIVFAYYFGAQSSMDLYYLATNIVSLFNVCFCVSIPMAFLTIFINKGLRSATVKKQETVMSNTISAFLCIAIVLTVILIIVAPWMEDVVVPSISTAESQRLSTYIRLLSFIVILYCFSGLLSASLECLENYIPSKLTSFFVSFSSVIFAVLLGKKFGAIVAVYGSLCGIGLHAIYAYLILRKKRKIQLQWPKFDENVKSILSLSIPMMVSVAITSINSLVDKLIAVKIGEGTVSALNYASLLSRELISGVLVMAISSIVASRFSENILQRDFNSLNKNINLILYTMLLIVFPLMIFYFTYTDEIIGFVFERGAFDLKAKSLTISAFTGYIFGLFFLPFREIFIRVQYAYQDSRGPMINSLISVLVNVFFSIVLGFKFGIIGISLATSIATIINCILSYYWIKRTKIFDIKLNFIMFSKLTFNLMIVWLIASFVKFNINDSVFATLFFAFIGIFICFMIVTYFTNKMFFINALLFFKNKGNRLDL